MSKISFPKLTSRLLLLTALLGTTAFVSLERREVEARGVQVCGVVCCLNQFTCIEDCHQRIGSPGFNLAACHSKCRMRCGECAQICNVNAYYYCPFPDYTHCPLQ
jgi:hypothetical protein